LISLQSGAKASL